MGPRVLARDEANRLIPRLEAAFVRFDVLRQRAKDVRVKMTALEVIWAERVSEPSCPDHGEYEHHVAALERVNQEFAAASLEIEELGGVVKGIDMGLVDFYAVKDGRLVFLCWQRGEKEVAFWHHVDSGYAGRQPLSVPAG